MRDRFRAKASSLVLGLVYWGMSRLHDILDLMLSSLRDTSRVDICTRVFRPFVRALKYVSVFSCWHINSNYNRCLGLEFEEAININTHLGLTGGRNSIV